MNYKLVYICSPLRPVSTEAAEKEAELNNNIALARDACTLAVYRGFLPVAPHLYFPQFLNDEVAAERNLGLDMGKALLRQCTQLWIISPRISNGMSAEIKEAQKYGITVQERGDLEARHCDSEDFIEVSVWGLEAALKDAYEAGRKSK